MKIAVFGASVSEQTVRHDTGEMTGYCEALRRHHLPALGACELVQLCHPGNRLSDGGLYQLDDVVAAEPALCVVEPLIEDTSRGREATADEARFVYARLVGAGIVPLTLFLPEPPQRAPTGTGRHALFRRVCEAAGLPTASVDLHGLASLDAHFEGIHTTALGAELYAQAVVRAVAALGPLDALAGRLRAALPRLASAVRVQCLTDRPEPVVRRLVLRLRNRAAAAGRVRLVQPHTIGPFSPVLDVVLGGAGVADRSLRRVWDPYCHFERRSYVVLDERVLPAQADCTVAISVSAQDPPYERCRRPVAAWPAPAERMLRPLGPVKLVSTVDVEAELLVCEP